MATISDITIDPLAQAFKDLSPLKKIELKERSPKNWFADMDYQLSDDQKRALDAATAKEERGESVWHTWDAVKRFINEGER